MGFGATGPDRIDAAMTDGSHHRSRPARRVTGGADPAPRTFERHRRALRIVLVVGRRSSVVGRRQRRSLRDLLDAPDERLDPDQRSRPAPQPAAPAAPQRRLQTTVKPACRLLPPDTEANRATQVMDGPPGNGVSPRSASGRGHTRRSWANYVRERARAKIPDQRSSGVAVSVPPMGLTQPEQSARHCDPEFHPPPTWQHMN
jgi:hypothetical protein